MFCTSCGTKNMQNSAFCTKCGKAVHPNVVTEQGSISETPVNQSNMENLSLWKYFLKCFKNYATFSGRARRKEYWGFVLFNFIIACVISFIGGFYVGFTGSGGTFVTVMNVLYYLYCLAVAIPSLAVAVRRLHDIGKSGWNYLWCFTIIGVIPLIIWLCREGDAGYNRYGSNPKVNY